VSSKVFDALDDHMWKLTYKWAMWSHPHKGKRWIVRRYFGRFVPSRRDRWVFGDRDSGAYLLKSAWTKITRHTLVKGWASPDDPALASYWTARRRRGNPPLRQAELRLLKAQQARCAACGGLLLHADQEPQHPDEWEQWITAVRKAVRRQAVTIDAGPGTPDQRTAIRLIRTHCRRRLPDAAGGEPALLQS
jgi:RNA-directed DNA polymerase